MTKEKNILVTDIQRFSLHDGPGIRTTVFLKGCPLRCPWCSNPETQERQPESYVRDGRRGVYGRYMSCDEIYREVIKDKDFYDEGGATYSGGEPLLQMEALEPLMDRLKKEGLHQCVETCMFGTEDSLKIALKYISLYYVDIKILAPEECEEILKGDVRIYERNVDILFQADKPVVFRIPCIVPYVTEKGNQERIIQFIKEYRPCKVELIKGHNLGAVKYRTLGRAVPVLKKVPEKQIQFLAKEFSEMGIRTEICEV